MKDYRCKESKKLPLDEIGRIIVPHRKPATIKVSPEDFVVCEVVEHAGESVTLKPFYANNLMCGRVSSDLFCILDMTKIGVESGRAVQAIASHCNIPRQCISLHGKKDARAITVQRICVPTEVLSKLQSFDHPSIFLSYVCSAKRPLTIGGHRGNYFEIVTHNNAAGPVLEIDTPRVHRNGFWNYFGPQRFGGGSGYSIGQALVEGRNAAAFEMMRANWFYQNNPIIKKSGDLFGCLGDMEFRDNLRFSLQQFQSYLFNTLISHRCLSNDDVPQMQHVWTPTRASEYQEVWAGPVELDERLKQYLIARSRPRSTRVFPKDLACRKEGNGYKFVFELPKGVFATQLLSEFFELYQGPQHRKVA